MTPKYGVILAFSKNPKLTLRFPAILSLLSNTA